MNNNNVEQHQASCPNVTLVVDYLLSKRCDIDLKTHAGCTSLIAAAKNNHDDVVKSLVEAGADVEIADNTGKRAIDYAKANENKITVAILAGEKQEGHRHIME